MRFIFAVVVLIAITGCATRPAFDYNPSTIQEVGVLVALENNLSHSHVGTTVFNNSVETFPSQSFMPVAFLEEQAREILEDRGYRVSIVKLPEDGGFTDRSLLHAGWSGLGIRAENREPLAELIRSEGVDLLVVFEPFYRHDHMGGSSVGISGFGLYTRSFFGFSGGRIYSNVRGCGILADPVVYVDCGVTSDNFDTEITELNAETAPEVEDGVKKLFGKVVEDTVRQLGL
ncbi:MAG: hypothetical protein ACXIUL_03720 [Wenzhouxiangella sp.]